MMMMMMMMMMKMMMNVLNARLGRLGFFVNLKYFHCLRFLCKPKVFSLFETSTESTACNSPLGMTNTSSQIPSENLHISSMKASEVGKDLARLDSSMCWVAANADNEPWIAVDLGATKYV